jgi:hypothetical protein
LVWAVPATAGDTREAAIKIEIANSATASISMLPRAQLFVPELGHWGITAGVLPARQAKNQTGLGDTPWEGACFASDFLEHSGIAQTLRPVEQSALLEWASAVL